MVKTETQTNGNGTRGKVVMAGAGGVGVGVVLALLNWLGSNYASIDTVKGVQRQVDEERTARRELRMEINARFDKVDARQEAMRKEISDKLERLRVDVRDQ